MKDKMYFIQRFRLLVFVALLLVVEMSSAGAAVSVNDFPPAAAEVAPDVLKSHTYQRLSLIHI